MESNCRVNMATKKASVDPGLDGLIRASAIAKKAHPEQNGFRNRQVNADDLNLILYVDCTKLGIMDQNEFTWLGEYASKIMSRNPASPLSETFPCIPASKDRSWCCYRRFWWDQMALAACGGTGGEYSGH